MRGVSKDGLHPMPSPFEARKSSHLRMTACRDRARPARRTESRPRYEAARPVAQRRNLPRRVDLADEAIRLLEGRTDIRAVFTDINMTGSMDGWKLAHAIRGRWPPIHLLLTSGLAVPAEGQMPERGRFLRKPYSAEQVTSILRDLFGENPIPGSLIVGPPTKRDRIA